MTTSSPRYAQSNGQAERMVQTVKKMLKKAADSGNDWFTALLQYRNSPIADSSFSPAQLLFNRQLRTKLPVMHSSLTSERDAIACQELVNCQEKQREYYDRSTKPLQSLHPGDVVQVRHDSAWQPAIVSHKSTSFLSCQNRHWIHTPS
jgi:hypothetical protein